MALRLSGHVYLSGHGDVRCVVEHPSDCVNDRLPGASRGRPHGQLQQQLLRAIREQGLDVPGDIALVTFDGIEESAFSWPSLTLA